MAIFYNDRGVWDSTKVYLGAYTDDNQTVERAEGGDFVWYQGARWFANHYTIDVNPMLDLPDIAGPGYDGNWILDTSGPAINYNPVAPNAPTGLEVGYTSDDTVTLFWNPAYVPGLGNVTSYNIFADGIKIGTSTTTSFAISALSASTNYNFTVSAVNSTGPSPTAALVVQTDAPETANGKYYSPYIDMTLPTTNLIDLAKASNLRDFTLAFLQTSDTVLDSEGFLQSGAIPSLAWGGIENTTLPTGVIINQIKQIQEMGGTVTIALGGYSGRDLAVTAADYADDLFAGGMSRVQADNAAAAHLQMLYQSIIDTYGVTHLDFDVENSVHREASTTPDAVVEATKIPVVDDVAANILRFRAINGLNAANEGLHISLTVATSPNGVSDTPGTTTIGLNGELYHTGGSGDVRALIELAHTMGVDIDVVNIMAMDYFDGAGVNDDMGDNAISAARAMHALLTTIGLDALVGITPMLGQNDAHDGGPGGPGNEVFTLADAQDLMDFFASTPWVAGIGAWQLTRDRENAVDTTDGSDPAGDGAAPVSNSTGLIQGDFDFSDILSQIALWRATGGRGDDVINGTAASDTLSGLGGADTLDGKAGADTLDGGAGNDLLYVDNAADQVIEAAGGGTDRVLASVSYTLTAAAQVEILSTTATGGPAAINLTGNGFTQFIYGNNGANTIDGKGGADIMTGYAGNDIYYVDNASDQALEGVGGGSDRVYASVSHALTATSEIEFMATTSTAGVDAINLTGNMYVQSIYGNAGANIIDGKGGADTMVGYGGNDQYYVDNAGDHVIEVAAGGSDRVLASVNYTLEAAAQVEIFSTTSSIGVGAINLIGNAFNQLIYGNAGANTINGKAGADNLTGYAGADIFVFDTALGAANIDTITDYNVAADTIRIDDAIFAGAGFIAGQFIAANAFVIGAAATTVNQHIIYNNVTGDLIFDSNGNGVGGSQVFAHLAAGLNTMTNADFFVV